MHPHDLFDMLSALTFPALDTLLLSVLPVLASLIAIASGVPQLTLMLRTKSATGVSIAGWATNASASAAWIGYSLWRSDISTAIAMAIPATLTVAVLVLANLWGGDRRGMATPFAFWAVVASVAAFGTPAMLAVVLATTVFWSYGPSIYGMWTAKDLSGNSIATWVLAAGYGVVWASYGLLLGQPAIMVNGLINLLLGGAVLTGLVLARRGIRDVVVATATAQFAAITTATAQFAVIRPATAALNIIRPATVPIDVIRPATVPIDIVRPAVSTATGALPLTSLV